MAQAMLLKNLQNNALNLRQDFLPIKTGLFAPEIQGHEKHEKFVELIKTAFTDTKIKMKTYDGVSDTLGYCI